MTAERFRQIRNVFDAALEREPAARDAFVAEACQGDEELRAEVDHLLAAQDQKTSWLDAETSPATGRLEGRRIGSYEVLRTLGEGGMGTVYLAARADGAFRKLVALKIVRPESASAEVLRRFQQEREILGSLEHPNIARILDGGHTADGLPYLVMEYVEGQPIDDFCDEHRLTVYQRLALFQQVCSAVRYAHSKQVVHRDLKPSNVLVAASGQVKLLDFGIAKLLASSDEMTLLRTRSDLRLMTPEYASPEQVRGEDVTAASDVYSLGVLLYELLTGRRPYRLRSRILHEVVRIICEEPPTRPSTAVTDERDREDDPDSSPEALSRMRGVSPRDLRRELSGNLDGILLKSLEKDPHQRYRSVEEFGEELQRHLRGERVQAGKSRLFHSIGTLAKRHPWWILIALAFALATWNGWISDLALTIAGLTLISCAIGFWNAHREFGAGLFSKSFIEKGLKRVTILAVAVWALFSFLTQTLRIDLFNMSIWESLIGLLGLWTLFILLRWFLRKRIFGPVLLDLSWSRSKILLMVWVLAAIPAVALLVKDFPNPALQNFVQLHIANRPPETSPVGYGDTSVPVTVYAALSRQHDVFWTVIAYAPLFEIPPHLRRLIPDFLWPGVPVRFGSRKAKAFGEEVSDNFFPALHMAPFLGRWFSPMDRQQQLALNRSVVVLSYSWWRRNFAGASNVIGQVLYVKEIPFTIIGVISPEFTGVDPYHPIDFWIPLENRPKLKPWGMPSQKASKQYGSASGLLLLTLERLQPGVTQEQALTRSAPLVEKALGFGEASTSQQLKLRIYFSAGVTADEGAQKVGFPKTQLLSFAYMACLWYLASRVEFRARGLAVGGFFIPLRHVTGYSWGNRIGKFEVLRLRLTGLWRWFSIRGVLVKQDMRPKVEELLKQQLGEWPRGSQSW